jgi:RNA polymerase sigma factor (sigma-70 family)
MAGITNKFTNPNKANIVLAAPSLIEGENELWLSLRSGSREALNSIFEKNCRHLYSYGRNITPDKALIADCVQDLFVELWIKREALTARVNSIKFYLLKSLRRRIIRALSDNKRISERILSRSHAEEVEFNIEVNIIRNQLSVEQSLQLQASLETLNSRQREAIYLKFYEGMTNEQIASVMSINLKAVYNLVARSISALQKFFKAHPLPCE